MPSSCLYFILFLSVQKMNPSSVPMWLWDRLEFSPLFSACSLLLLFSVLSFHYTMDVTQLWEKKHNCTFVQRCPQLKIQTAYSIFPTAVMCTVWFLKQDKISQYQKIENAFELQSIYITRYSVRLILSLGSQLYQTYQLLTT